MQALFARVRPLAAASATLLCFFPFTAPPTLAPPLRASAAAPCPPPLPAAAPPPHPPPPLPPAYSNGREALAFISQVFRQARQEQRAGQPLRVGAVVSAGQAAAYLYPVIFGQGSLVATILTRITSRHCALLHAMASDPTKPAEARASLRALLVWEARQRSGSSSRGAAATDRHSASHAALWVMRVLDFIQCYLSIMCSSTSQPPSACARAAYDAKLAPYHGYMIKSLSRTALWYVPNDRDALYVGFGYIERGTLQPHASLGLGAGATLEQVNGAVCADLAQCAQCMAPVLQEIIAALDEVDPGSLQSKSQVVVE